MGSFKIAWATYCQHKGNGTNDPGKHDMEFLREFLEFIGRCSLVTLSSQGVELTRFPKQNGPPSKRPRLDTNALIQGSQELSRFPQFPPSSHGATPAPRDRHNLHTSSRVPGG